jgi:hypothetical protein
MVTTIEESTTQSCLKPVRWRKVLALGFLAGVGFAQVAQITGRVTDRSGAPIPDVKITVTDTDNGIARDTKTNGLGYYTLPLLNPGNYNIVAGKQGFRGAEQTGIQLRADQEATIDFKLEAGQLNLNQNIPVKTVELKNAQGQSAGTATVSEAKGGSGVTIQLSVKNLPPGEHAFGIHQNAKCELPGFTGAGGHFNADNAHHGIIRRVRIHISAT